VIEQLSVAAESSRTALEVPFKPVEVALDRRADRVRRGEHGRIATLSNRVDALADRLDRNRSEPARLDHLRDLAQRAEGLPDLPSADAVHDRPRRRARRR